MSYGKLRRFLLLFLHKRCMSRAERLSNLSGIELDKALAYLDRAYGLPVGTSARDLSEYERV